MNHSSREKSLFLIILIYLFLLSACQSNQPDIILSPYSSSTLKTSVTSTQASSLNSTSTVILTSPTQTAAPSSESNGFVTLMAVGDIMLGRSIGELIKAEGIEAPFIFTAEMLNMADITLGNLECPISNRGTPEEKTYTFCAPLEAAQSLVVGGFDLVSLANNHILDFGPEALEDTLQLLAAQNILTTGAGMDEATAYSPVFTEINGLRLAFLAFMDMPLTDYDYHEWEAGPEKPGIAWAHQEKITKHVQKAKENADLVIVLFHNGYEITKKVYPTQQEVARLAIDSGATLVIGSHPHVLQDIEEYKDGLIVYSMGNFVFDNFLFPPNYSAILSIELSAQGIESYELIDVIVQLNGVPQIMPYDLDE